MWIMASHICPWEMNPGIWNETFLKNTHHFVHGTEDKQECMENYTVSHWTASTSPIHPEEVEVDLVWSCDVAWFSFQNHSPRMGGWSKRKTQNGMDGDYQIMHHSESLWTVEYDERPKAMEGSFVMHQSWYRWWKIIVPNLITEMQW